MNFRRSLATRAGSACYHARHRTIYVGVDLSSLSLSLFLPSAQRFPDKGKLFNDLHIVWHMRRHLHIRVLRVRMRACKKRGNFYFG